MDLTRKQQFIAAVERGLADGDLRYVRANLPALADLAAKLDCRVETLTEMRRRVQAIIDAIDAG